MIIPDFMIEVMPENIQEVARRNNFGKTDCVATNYGFTVLVKDDGSYDIISHKFNLWDYSAKLSWDCEYFFSENVLNFVLTINT